MPGSASVMPFLNAEKAAREILDACRAGMAELILTIPAQMAVRLHSLFPESTIDLLGIVNRILPKPGGIGRERLTGGESKSHLSPSIVTTLNDWAARNYNQLVGARLEGLRAFRHSGVCVQLGEVTKKAIVFHDIGDSRLD